MNVGDLIDETLGKDATRLLCRSALKIVSACVDALCILRTRQPLRSCPSSAEMFELHGGEDAFINIKYMLPTYESKVLRD